MKKILSTIIFASLILYSPRIVLASEEIINEKATHLSDSAAINSVTTSQGETHRFKLHVVENPLSEVSIELPENVEALEEIKVIDTNAKELATIVNIDNGIANLAFSQPVPANTVVSIKMYGVKDLGFSNRNWLYRVYGKEVGLAEDIPIGTAEIRTHRR